MTRSQELGGGVTARNYDGDDLSSQCGIAMPAAEEWLESPQARE